MTKTSILCIGALLLLCVGCNSSTDVGESESEAKEIEVEAFEFVKLPGGSRIVRGRLHNPSSTLINNAQVQLALYDADNRLIDTIHFTIQEIHPGKSKPFREPITIKADVRGARVRSVLVL